MVAAPAVSQRCCFLPVGQSWWLLLRAAGCHVAAARSLGAMYLLPPVPAEHLSCAQQHTAVLEHYLDVAELSHAVVKRYQSSGCQRSLSEFQHMSNILIYIICVRIRVKLCKARVQQDR